MKRKEKLPRRQGKKAPIKKILLILLCVGLVASFFMGAVNIGMVQSTKKRILSAVDAGNLKEVDCILVLGCKVRPDGSPSAMLSDRVDQSVEVYLAGGAPKILMSGDHGKADYNEPLAMKQTALGQGVPEEDIFLDHAGFSTYESIYRAKAVFGAKKIIIVTQEYHLPRALHLAKVLGLEAYGVAADGNNYSGQGMRDLREFLARGKDFVQGIFRPKPKNLGQPVSLKGDGSVTDR